VASIFGDQRARATIGLPAALAGVLCLVGITSRSLGFDEAATVTIASQHGSTLGSAIAHDGGNMSGYYLLLHILIGIFGDGLLVIRLPSAIASVATVALVGMIGRRLFGARAGFAAGLLAAVSLPLVFWAQNARGYAPMVAFACAAFLAFISIAPGPGQPAPRRRHWIAYVLLMALAIYSSFVAVLLVPAQLVVLARRPRLAVRFGLALLALAALCTPLLVLALHRGSSQLFWVPRPNRKLDTQVLQSLTSAGLVPSFHPTATTTALLVLTLALVLAIAGLVAKRAHQGGREQWGPGVILAWLLVPVVLAWLASYVIQPLFLPRNLLMSVPPVALLLGLGATEDRLPRALALTGLVAVLALRGLQLSASYGVSPEPWEPSTAYVLDRARAGDCVAFYPEDSRMAFQYYVGTGARRVGRAPRSILPVARWGRVIPFVEDYATLSPGQVRRRGARCRRLWFVSSHEGQPDGPARSRSNRARFLRLRARLDRAFGPGGVKQFGYAGAIHVQLLPGADRPRVRARARGARRGP